MSFVNKSGFWTEGEDGYELVYIPPEHKEKVKENIMKMFNFTGTYEEFIQSIFYNTEEQKE